MDELDRAEREVEEFRQRAEAAEYRLAGFAGAEAMLGRTLLLAQRAADKTMARAAQDAADLIAAAKVEARADTELPRRAHDTIDHVLASRDARVLDDVDRSHQRVLASFDHFSRSIEGGERPASGDSA